MAVMYMCYFITQLLITDAFMAISRSAHVLILSIGMVGVSLAFPPLLANHNASYTKIISRSLFSVLMHFLICSSIYAIAQIWMGDRHLFFVFWGLFAALLTIERLTLYLLKNKLWSNNKYTCPIVLVGRMEGLATLYKEFSCPTSGYQVNGIFSDDLPEALPQDLHHLGSTAQTTEYLSTKDNVRAVFCQTNSLTSQETTELLDYCLQNEITFYGIPEHLHNQHRHLTIENFGETELMTPKPEPISHWTSKLLKRVTDFTLSFIFLAIIFPFIYLAVVFIMKRNSPGPVFVPKKYEGRNGEKHTGLLFRVQHVSAENGEKEYAFGNFLRKLHIDEMPLFFEILRGNISLVGPRYHACMDMSAYHDKADRYGICSLAKPGLSGCNMTKGAEDSIKDDIAYVQNWSIWLDLYFIVRMSLRIFNTNINKYHN